MTVVPAPSAASASVMRLATAGLAAGRNEQLGLGADDETGVGLTLLDRLDRGGAVGDRRDLEGILAAGAQLLGHGAGRLLGTGDDDRHLPRLDLAGGPGERGEHHGEQGGQAQDDGQDRAVSLVVSPLPSLGVVVSSVVVLMSPPEWNVRSCWDH